MQKWTRPNSYIGPSYHGYYVGPGQNRDSDALARSNFRVALERLGGESVEQVELTPGKDDSEHVWPVMVVRDSHWACGWIEYILVHESAVDKVAILEGIESDLESYPVLDDSDFSQEESDEQDETFNWNCAEFRRELFKFLKFKEPSVRPRGKRDAEVDEVTMSIYRDSCGYSGQENGWVRADDIRRYFDGEGKWAIPRMARDGNSFARALVSCGIVQPATVSA